MLTDLRRELKDGCISDLRFDEWYAGELPPTEVSQLAQHLKHCERCLGRSEQIRKQRSALLVKHPDLSSIERSQRASEKLHRADFTPLRSVRARRRGLWGFSAAGLAVAAVLLLVPRLKAPEAPPDESNTRLKGAPRFGFAIKRGEKVLAGRNGQVVYPRDRLRFLVSTSTPQHLAILSRDGRGVVTEYYPGTGRSRAIAASSNALLESSVELDESLGREELWAVFCKEPFEVGGFINAIRQQGDVSPSHGCSVDRLDIDKQVQP
jgi:hypothetical protein